MPKSERRPLVHGERGATHAHQQDTNTHTRVRCTRTPQERREASDVRGEERFRTLVSRGISFHHCSSPPPTAMRLGVVRAPEACRARRGERASEAVPRQHSQLA